MEIFGPIILPVISGLSTLLGTLIIFFNIKKVGEFITFSLSLSMTIMILISIFELIPESLNTIILKYNYFYGIILSILTFALGYQTVYFINKNIKSNNNLYKIGIISIISMILHNFLEGSAVFITSYNSIKLGIKICSAIIVHNIPEGMIISIPLYYSGFSRGRVVLYTLIASISEPLGALLSYIFLRRIITNELLSFILLFVSGLMISISLNEILKEILSYNNKKYMIIGIIIGLLIIGIIL